MLKIPLEDQTCSSSPMSRREESADRVLPGKWPHEDAYKGQEEHSLRFSRPGEPEEESYVLIINCANISSRV